MNVFSTIPGLASARPGSEAAATGSASLGQEDFLRLLTTQLKQQDPFEPADQTQMIAQMAQFSNLAGQSEMNTTLREISDKLDRALAASPIAPTE